LVRGLAIGGFGGDGVEGKGGGSKRLEGCLLGPDPDGVTRRGNTGDGGNVVSPPSGKFLGGSLSGARCLISANDPGGGVSSVSFNTVKGCLIGSDAGGTLDRGNTNSGVLITGSTARFNTIGGTPAERNVISGNGEDFSFEDHGITIFAGISNSILGNYIGL